MSREKRMMNRRKSNNKNSKSIEKKTITEHITNIVNNKKLLVIMIVSVITLVTLLSTSFAMLMKSASSSKEELYKSGTLTVKLDKNSEGTEININPAKPISDEYGMATVKPYTFTITNTGTTNASYEVYLDETIVNNNDLTDDQVRQYIRYQIDDETPRSLGGQGSNIIVRGGIHPSEDLTFNLKLWIDIDAPNEMAGTEYSAKVGVKGKATNRMQPNGPEIVDGLIPVTYDEKTDNWIKADTSTSWYNYEKQEWANTVTVTNESRETYLLAKAGTPIDMDDINTMWVWVPRYKYRIPKNIGIGSDEVPIENPPEIDIIFESRYEVTGVEEQLYRSSIKKDGTIDDSVNNGEKIYYTHPAFRNINNIKANIETTNVGGWDHELTGIWIGKFSIGTDNTTCNSNSNVDNCKDVDPIIKPNVKSLRYQYLSTQFKTSLKFTNGTFSDDSGGVSLNKDTNNKYGFNIKNNRSDSHMMKNTEWGAVAYLSQSRYGKIGNKNYEVTNKEIYVNNSNYYTGRSGGAPAGLIQSQTLYPSIENTEVNNETGYYTYNDYFLEYNENTETTKTKNAGIGASTTGSIYGIYDMSSYFTVSVMGNFNLTIASSQFSQIPSNKYCDYYNKWENAYYPLEKDKTILGDATWETQYWYNDFGNGVFVVHPWFYRNYNFDSSRLSSPGIFSAFSGIGSDFLSVSHTTLVP